MANAWNRNRFHFTSTSSEMYFKIRSLWYVALPGIFLAACVGNNSSMKYQDIKDQSVRELRTVLDSQSEWVKVHAAEFLLWAGYPEGVSEAFKEEEKSYEEKSQYRIGIWRVLAQAAPDSGTKARYTDKIARAFLDTGGTDRIHAAETLAKLGISPVGLNAAVVREALQSSVKPLALYTKWSVAYTSPDSMASSRAAFLDLIRGGEPAGRSTAAYSLRKLGGLSQEEWNDLSGAALDEPLSSASSVYLLSTALVTAPVESPDSVYARLHTAILEHAKAPGKGDRMEMCMALSERGTEEDIPLLTSLLRNEFPLGKEADDADVRAGAAYALLKIIEKTGNGQRSPGHPDAK